jgi:hypothetical protein
LFAVNLTKCTVAAIMSRSGMIRIHVQTQIRREEAGAGSCGRLCRLPPRRRGRFSSSSIRGWGPSRRALRLGMTHATLMMVVWNTDRGALGALVVALAHPNSGKGTVVLT